MTRVMCVHHEWLDEKPCPYCAERRWPQPTERKEKRMEKIYLGDGLFAEFDGFQIRVFAHDGISDTNEVFFEGQNLKVFLEFVKHVEEISA